MFKVLGCFFVDVRPQIRVISLNTLYLFASNDAVRDCSETKKNMHQKLGSDKWGRGCDEQNAGDCVLDWLESLLQISQEMNMSVQITGHIPPSYANYKKRCYDRFAQIGTKYRTMIKSQFYGHLNIDHFYFATETDSVIKPIVKKKGYGIMLSPSWVISYCRNLIDHYKNINEMAESQVGFPILVSPSIVPAFNPSFRVFKISTDPMRLGEVVGYTQYWLDLAAETIEVAVEYSFQNAYEFDYRKRVLGWIDLAGRIVNGEYLRAEYFLNMVVGRKIG